MPNWCCTTYHFRGDEAELRLLNKNIEAWTSKSFTKSDFGSSWLGNILIGAGLKSAINSTDDSKYLNCRGSLIDISDVEDGCFSVVTETAWTPMARMWEAVIEKLGLKTVGFTFMAEEAACGVFWIYDPHGYNDFKEEVYIDTYGSAELDEINYYYNEADAIKVLNKFFGTEHKNLNSFKELCEDYNEEHEDSYISFHRFEIDNELLD